MWSNRTRGDQKKQAAGCLVNEGAPPPVPDRKAFRLAWSVLLARVWGVDVLKCRCGGDRSIISAITKHEVIERILRHLGLFDLPRAPDGHLCEDRDPTAAGRHPLLEENAPDGPAASDDWPAPDVDPGWPLDTPHAED